ncbi:MAG: translational GTPase TypA, partial [Clostridiales bacterium]|nr:translational GTPase TypA [Clostridiales bacterium]
DRGNLFISAQTAVYAGMVCGQSNRPGEIVVNVCKTKHVTNVRNSSSAEDSLRLVSVQPLTLEESMEFIDDDELLEVTPKALRIRKRELNHDQRMRTTGRKKAAEQ